MRKICMHPKVCVPSASVYTMPTSPRKTFACLENSAGTKSWGLSEAEIAVGVVFDLFKNKHKAQIIDNSRIFRVDIGCFNTIQRSLKLSSS